MSGNWAPPAPVLEVALTDHPRVDLDDATWTDLSDRIETLEVRRGRSDYQGTFEPGTLAIDLNNDDRMLDPSRPGSLVERDAGKGLPLSPVRFSLAWNGSTYPLFVGWLGPECWEGSTRGATASVKLDAFDRLGFLGQVPFPSGWKLIAAYLNPDWWIPGDADFPVAGAGGTLPSFAPGGGVSTVAGTGVVWLGGNSMLSDHDVAMLVGPDTSIVSDEADVMPSGAEAAITFQVLWQPQGTSASDQIIGHMVHGALTRWSVVCNPAGEIVATINKLDGTLAGTITAPPNPYDGGGRWDNTTSKQEIRLRITGGSEAKLWVGGYDATMAGTVPATIGAGDLVVGGSDQYTKFDEIMFWRSAVPDLTAAISTLYLGAGLQPALGDDLPARVSHVYQAAGVDPASGESAQWHVGADDSTLAPSGMAALYYSAPTVAGMISVTAEQWGGVAWATRTGEIRVRSITALDNPAYADDYATPCANLTDEPSPAGSPQPVRRGEVSFSGVRMDRITNVATVGFSMDGLDPDGFPVSTSLRLTSRDTDSVDRYGERQLVTNTDVLGWAWAGTLGSAVVTRRSVPPIEVKDVTLRPWGDDDATLWLLAECELERAVTLTHTPPGESPVSLDLNIQAERWDWSKGTDWAVSLSLGPSR